MAHSKKIVTLGMGLLLLAGAFGAQAYTGEALEKHAKVTMTEARAIALKAHPGKITDEEFFPLLAEDLWRVPMDVRFRLRCNVAADTRIDCRILSESPTIPGVRTAVLRGLPILRMRPPMRDGRPVLDQPVEFEWRVGQHNRFSVLDH